VENNNNSDDNNNSNDLEMEIPFLLWEKQFDVKLKKVLFEDDQIYIAFQDGTLRTLGTDIFTII